MIFGKHIKMKYTSDNKKVKETLSKVYKILRKKGYSIAEVNNFIENRMKIHTLKINGLLREAMRK